MLYGLSHCIPWSATYNTLCSQWSHGVSLWYPMGQYISQFTPLVTPWGPMEFLIRYRMGRERLALYSREYSYSSFIPVNSLARTITIGSTIHTPLCGWCPIAHSMQGFMRNWVQSCAWKYSCCSAWDAIDDRDAPNIFLDPLLKKAFNTPQNGPLRKVCA